MPLVSSLRRKIIDLLPDSLFLRFAYPRFIGRPLHLRHPRTLNEKTQWLKLHDRRPVYKIMADKYAAKKFVADRVGAEHVVPLLGVWNSFDEIDFASLPDQFVLKTTHDSGGVVLCDDKQTFNFKKARETLDASLARDYFLFGREWAYKSMPRRIIAEPMLPLVNGDLPDYKVFTFNGEAKLTFVATNRHRPGGVLMNFYDREWNALPCSRYHPRNPIETECPKNYPAMIRLAEEFGKDMPLLRTDFYLVDERVYIGELTIYPSSGFDRFDPESYDELFGSWLHLPCDR